MKKTYEKPVLTKRGMLSRVTAQQAPSGAQPD
ncbi:putative RiPP precursor [Mesorhizobium argentiipisi]|uniref:RiPP n=1 Tax=Mesorhizobium argentiipisi TaxID=3015175 RepID=A0ABU8KEC8_9HYPH